MAIGNEIIALGEKTMIKIICDKCGSWERYKKGVHMGIISYYPNYQDHTSNTESTFELCLDCIDKMVNNKKEVKKDGEKNEHG